MSIKDQCDILILQEESLAALFLNCDGQLDEIAILQEETLSALFVDKLTIINPPGGVGGEIEILPDFAITSGGQTTVSHSFGVRPTSVQVDLVCIDPEFGYNIGDVVPTILGPQRNNHSGVSVLADANDAEITFGTTLKPMNIMKRTATAGKTTSATNEKWEVRITLKLDT